MERNISDFLVIRCLVGGALTGFGFAAAALTIVLSFLWSPEPTPGPTAVQGGVHVIQAASACGATVAHCVLHFSAFQSTAMRLLVMLAFPTAVLGILIVPKVRWSDSVFDWRYVMDNGTFAICAASAAVSLGLLLILGPFVVKALNWAGVVLTFSA